MKKLVIFLVILILIPLMVALLFKRVPPATIGVKQGQWGGGIIEADHPTGFRLGVSGYHKWHFLPATTHFIHFTETPDSTPSPTVTYLPPFTFRTSDQNTITYDITVAYRIAEGGAWQIVKDSLKLEYQSKVKSKVESVLRDQLVKFSSEDLQITDLRMQLVADALPILQDDLAEFHCEAESILIRRFRFREGYEGQLQEKQFLRQKALLDAAQTAVAEQEQLVNVKERKIVAAELALVQDWEKRVQEKQSEYDVLLATIRAEAEVYAAETMAEGDAELVIATANGNLAVEKAEALRNELRNVALNSKGGHILLALEAAQNLHIPRVTLNSDDPNVPTILDLGELTKMLVGSEPAE